MVEKIFEDEYVSIYYSYNNSDVAVFSYNSMRYDFSSKGVPGLAALRNVGVDVFGVISNGDNWYPQASMKAAAAALADRLPRYRRRIGYGSSMGAYGALKHSASFGCDYVLALAPQYSINPATVGRWDGRFIRHFDENLHRNMEISAEDLSGISLIVVDPAMRPDQRHVSLIAEAVKSPAQVELINAWYCGHLPIQPIASQATLGALLSAIIADDLPEARKVYQNARKASPYYRASLLDALATSRMKQGRLDVALFATEGSVASYGNHAGFHITKSRVHSQRTEHSAAHDAALRALELEPANATARQLVDQTAEAVSSLTA